MSRDSWGEWPQRPGPPRSGGGWGQPQWVPPPRSRPQPTAVLPTAQPQQFRPSRQAAPPPMRRPGRPPSLRRPRWGRRIGATLLVLLLALAVFAVYVDMTLNRVDAIPADSTATSEGTNWLIVGSDSRDGLSDEEQRELATGGDVGQRTDTIMLLHSGSSGSVLVSLPRDSYVDIPGRGRDKLNAAYAFGGPELLVSTVEQATGLHIDHYVEIGFLGFVDAVDAVGGVEICAKQAIRDPKAALDIEAGCQEMDGATALGYVRTRATAGSDFDRVERQRQFLSALVSKATSPATLVNPIRVVPLAFAMSGAITVDTGDHVWNLAGLGLAMRSLTGGEGITTTVPVGGVGSAGGQSVVRWDKERALALFGALDRDERPPRSALGP